MATLPLFLILRENFDRIHCFHMASSGVFFRTPRRSKDVIFHENKKYKVMLDLFRIFLKILLVFNGSSPSLLHTIVVDTLLNFPKPFNIILTYTNTSCENAFRCLLVS